MAKKFYWRTAPTGTEGVNTVYIHELGSNEFGDGTRQKPYQTLDYWNVNGTPSLVVCIGTFTCPLLTGNHSTTIKGDYYGAATFDGKGLYCPYGFSMQNMRIINTGIEGISPGSYFGVGRAYYANNVGIADNVIGVASSFCFIDSCLLYMGVMGSTHNQATPTRGIYSRCKTNEGTYRLSLGRGTDNTYVNNPDPALWQKTISGNQVITYGLFGNTVVVINYANTYSNCLFASDTQFWCFKGTTYNPDTDVLITPVGSTSAERQADLIAKINAVYAEWGTTAVVPTFNSCVFSGQSSYDIFVDHEHQNYNVKRESDAVTNAGTYYGALPPAMHLPIYESSIGYPATWDERTCSGCVKVMADPSITKTPQPALICYDEASSATQGQILSKIVTINPAEVQISGIYAFFASKLSDYAIQLNKNSVFEKETKYHEGDNIPAGMYKVVGSIILSQTIEGVTEQYEVANEGIIFIVGESASFVNNGIESYLLPFADPNHMNAMYCRCRSTIYARAKYGDTLYKGVTYYNDNDHAIKYHGRNIAPGESFICEFDDETYVCDNTDCSIAILFDDRDVSDSERLVPTSEFIPANIWGSYFVDKSGGVMQHDADGIPIASGNYLSHFNTANGGYSDRIHKSIINQRYVQFALFVTKNPTL